MLPDDESVDLYHLPAALVADENDVACVNRRYVMLQTEHTHGENITEHLRLIAQESHLGLIPLANYLLPSSLQYSGPFTTRPSVVADYVRQRLAVCAAGGGAGESFLVGSPALICSLQLVAFILDQFWLILYLMLQVVAAG